MGLLDSVNLFESGWDPKHAERHTKLACTDRLRRQWAHVANGALHGGFDKPTAIKMANGTVRKTLQAALDGPVVRNPNARKEFLAQVGHTDGVPKKHHVDHREPLRIGGADHPKNMQLLTIHEHRRKTTRDSTMIRAIRARVGR